MNEEKPFSSVMAHEGGCLCGATRYVIQGALRGVNDCHCEDCRRNAGAAFMTWGGLSRRRFSLRSGEIRKVVFAQRIRGSAACCGTPLTLEDSEQDPQLEITVSTLDDPTPFPPVKIIWADDALPWATFDPRLPVYSRGTRSKLISPGRKERRA